MMRFQRLIFMLVSLSLSGLLSINARRLYTMDLTLFWWNLNRNDIAAMADLDKQCSFLAPKTTSLSNDAQFLIHTGKSCNLINIKKQHTKTSRAHTVARTLHQFIKTISLDNKSSETDDILSVKMKHSWKKWKLIILWKHLKL